MGTARDGFFAKASEKILDFQEHKLCDQSVEDREAYWRWIVKEFKERCQNDPVNIATYSMIFNHAVAHIGLPINTLKTICDDYVSQNRIAREEKKAEAIATYNCLITQPPRRV